MMLYSVCFLLVLPLPVVLSNAMLSHKMTVGQSSLLELGQPYSLWCTVDPTVETLETCVWRHEMDGEMHVEDGVVMDDDNNEVDGITVNTLWLSTKPSISSPRRSTSHGALPSQGSVISRA